VKEDDIRQLLMSMIDRIDAQVLRLDAIDRQLKRLDAIDGQLKSTRVELRTLADGVATIAGIQADTSKTLGMMNERLARMVEVNVRGRTDDAERYAALEARVATLEGEVRALAAGRGSWPAFGRGTPAGDARGGSIALNGQREG
jgi:hypothetical protein